MPKAYWNYAPSSNGVGLRVCGVHFHCISTSEFEDKLKKWGRAFAEMIAPSVERSRVFAAALRVQYHIVTGSSITNKQLPIFCRNHACRCSYVKNYQSYSSFKNQMVTEFAQKSSEMYEVAELGWNFPTFNRTQTFSAFLTWAKTRSCPQSFEPTFYLHFNTHITFKNNFLNSNIPT